MPDIVEQLRNTQASRYNRLQAYKAADEIETLRRWLQSALYYVDKDNSPSASVLAKEIVAVVSR